MNITPSHALQHAIARGGTPSMVGAVSRRFKRYGGRPGEIVEMLAPEFRAALRELRSSDVSTESVDRWAGWYAEQEYDDRMHLDRLLRQATEDFDRRVLRLEEGPRTLRHKKRRAPPC